MGLKFTVIFSAIFSAPFSGSGGELSDLPDDIIVSSGVITKVASKPMITKYFSGVTIRMPPAGKAAKLARVFLAQIPPRQRKDIELNYKLLAPSATAAPEIKVKFKDGTLLEVDPMSTSSREMVETFDRHSRKLQIADALKE